MTVRIIFLPDSELILPGRSGARSALSEWERLASKLVTTVVASSETRRVRVFHPGQAATGRPFPGRSVAHELVRTTGWNRSISDADPEIRAGAQLAPLTSGTVCLVMGTASAARDGSAPLPQQAAAIRFDDRAATALSSGRSDSLLELDEELAVRVGATGIGPWRQIAGLILKMNNLAPTGEDNYRLGRSTEGDFVRVNAGPLTREDRFGVCYLAALWTVAISG